MKSNKYERIISEIFNRHFIKNKRAIEFKREEIEKIAQELGIALPKNLGDLIYSFRYRRNLPKEIVEKAPEGFEWIIEPAGRSKYKFVLVPRSNIIPSTMLLEIKIPDSTPGIIEKYALTDEQALLAKLRYNRLIDIFTSLTCYSLQSHLRTTVPEFGQVETDELYIGLDKNGVHYVITVQAKSGKDKIGVVQIMQDIKVCKNKFPALVSKPVAAQFLEDNVICLFEFTKDENNIKIVQEKHFRLVSPNDLSADELQNYKELSLNYRIEE